MCQSYLKDIDEVKLVQIAKKAEDRIKNCETGTMDSFVNVSLFRLIQESKGYIQCLKNEAYFSSFHHARALIENFALVKFISSGSKDEANLKLERWKEFPKVKAHIFHLNNTENYYGQPSESQIQKWIELYKLNTKNDQIKELRKVANAFCSYPIKWTSEVIGGLGESYLGTYRLLSNLTHPSPLTGTMLSGKNWIRQPNLASIKIINGITQSLIPIGELTIFNLDS